MLYLRYEQRCDCGCEEVQREMAEGRFQVIYCGLCVCGHCFKAHTPWPSSYVAVVWESACACGRYTSVEDLNA